MSIAAYRQARWKLLQATSYNGWAARRGYSATAAARRQALLVELLQLRRQRPALATILPFPAPAPAAAAA